MAPIALLTILHTRLLSHALPDCIWLPYWHYQLVLTWYLHQPESHQLSLQKVSEWVRNNRTHGSDQGYLGPIKISAHPIWTHNSHPALHVDTKFNLKIKDEKRTQPGKANVHFWRGEVGLHSGSQCCKGQGWAALNSKFQGTGSKPIEGFDQGR